LEILWSIYDWTVRLRRRKDEAASATTAKDWKSVAEHKQVPGFPGMVTLYHVVSWFISGFFASAVFSYQELFELTVIRDCYRNFGSISNLIGPFVQLAWGLISGLVLCRPWSSVCWYAIGYTVILIILGGVEAFTEELKPYKQGKGSVQFPLTQPLPLELITRIVRFRVAESLKQALLQPDESLLLMV
jgi:hypothetical protein